VHLNCGPLLMGRLNGGTAIPPLVAARATAAPATCRSMLLLHFMHDARLLVPEIGHIATC
jgi:hypothetical protein